MKGILPLRILLSGGYWVDFTPPKLLLDLWESNFSSLSLQSEETQQLLWAVYTCHVTFPVLAPCNLPGSTWEKNTDTLKPVWALWPFLTHSCTTRGGGWTVGPTVGDPPVSQVSLLLLQLPFHPSLGNAF